MSLIIIIIGIIVFIGSVIALVNIFYFYYKGKFNNNNDVIRHLIAGIGAAILAPIIFNSLVTNAPDYNNVEFLVISGLCFLGGYLSDRFINSLGKNILIGFINTKSKVEKKMLLVKEMDAQHNFSATNEVDKKNYKLESIADEIEIEGKIKLVDIDMKTQEDKIIKSFSDKKKIRTAREIAVELEANSIVINDILEGLHGQGKLKKLTCLNGNVHWALTQLGLSLINSEN